MHILISDTQYIILLQIMRQLVLLYANVGWFASFV